jgi:membrane fusion protein (multidrug efflux system)
MTRSRWSLLLAAVAIAAMGVYGFWRHAENYPSTSDAYVTAHVVHIEPQVGGRITVLPVRDHQHVNQGQLLLQIDTRPYQIAVQKAVAELALAQQQKLAADAGVQAARATVNQRRAQLDDAQRNYARDSRLLVHKAVSAAQTETDRDKLREVDAALKAGEADSSRAIREQAEAEARIRVAQAGLAEARLNLAYTRISAPASGTLGEIPVHPGDVVQPGQQLFPLVEDQAFWVDANYKETDLDRIRPGQRATIAVDMYPDKTFHGVVESVSPASGVAFSLLPPENATGNWVKVTQRFPVRVRVSTDHNNTPLRVGASSSVTIDTTRTPEPGKSARNRAAELR